MVTTHPVGELDGRYSEPAATATSWEDALAVLASAGTFWLTTVRPDGRPHVTPLNAVWVDDALYFATGEDERKRRNLAGNPHCVLTTGCNRMGEGLDIVVEGQAIRVINERQLKVVSDALAEKYGEEWRFTAMGDVLEGKQGNVAWAYRVAPEVVFGFAKGNPFGQTRWSFRAS